MDHRASTLVLVTSLALGCSSSSDTSPGSTDSGSAPNDTATSDTSELDMGMDTEMDMGGPEAASKPMTPEIVDVMPMSGALHVSWKLNDTGLDNVLVWRNKDAGAYAIAYTLPGTATSQHDMDAMAPGTYCYKVQTKRGGVTSDESAEKCGTP